jgi:C_GCAxxG_C_C family probable redox protein
MTSSEIPEKAYALAYEHEQKYGSCPQGVLVAIHDTFGIASEEVIKAGHALAGGGALAGDGMCGALAGGIIALGCQFGRERKDFDKRQMKSFEIAKKLRDKFVAEYGGVTCHIVQKKIFGKTFNLWDKGEYKAFNDAGGHTDKCPSVAGNVAKWVAEILLAEGVTSK